MTAKEKDLWTPRCEVSAEDIAHMKSRVEVFHCSAKLRKLQDTAACPHCMCKWICEAAAAMDARSALQPALPVIAEEQEAGSSGEMLVDGLLDLVQTARLPKATLAVLSRDLIRLGATSVTELTIDDWGSCPAFASLKPLEQRRLLNSLGSLPPQ